MMDIAGKKMSSLRTLRVGESTVAMDELSLEEAQKLSIFVNDSRIVKQ
jgi:hypothetical protein